MSFFTKTSLLSFLLLMVDVCGLTYEEPAYTVVETFELFELRQYKSFTVAGINVTGDFDEIGNLAFRRLFKYINEDTRPEGKINMTVPVLQQLLTAGPKTNNSSTKRVLSQNRVKPTYRFAFIMPTNYSIDNLPDPADKDIHLRNIPGKLMAVRRYTGTWSEARYRKNEKILLEAVKQVGLDTIGTPIFARYNAPFSLWFLRRNEILIEVAPP